MKTVFEYRYSLLSLLGLLVGFFLMFPYAPWWKIVVNFLLVLVFWLVYRESTQEKTMNDKFFWFCFLFLFGFLFLSRIYPFFLNSVPLGYDSGIYKMQFELSQQALPDYVSYIFLGLPLITNVQYLLGFSLESVMAGWYVFWSLLIPLLLFVLAESTWGRRRALGVLFLFVISVTQWEAFQFMLYKNIIGLSFLLLSVLFIQRRSYLVLLPAFFLALLQPPDFLFFVFTMILYFALSFFDKVSRQYLLRLFCLALVGGLLLLVYDQDVWKQGLQMLLDFWSGADALNPIVKTGLFMSFQEYLSGSLVFLSLSFFAVIALFQCQKSRILISAYFVGLFIVFGQFLFHDRYIIEFDIMILLLSGALVVPLVDILWQEYMGRLVTLFLGVALLFNIALHVIEQGSWLSFAEVQRIQGFCDLVPEDAYIMATDSRYAPWIAGYSCHRTIAPGMFEWNLWNYEEWNVFWKMQDVTAISTLMDRYIGRDIYLYVGEKQPQLVLDERLFESEGDRLWRWRL